MYYNHLSLSFSFSSNYWSVTNTPLHKFYLVSYIVVSLGLLKHKNHTMRMSVWFNSSIELFVISDAPSFQVPFDLSDAKDKSRQIQR